MNIAFEQGALFTLHLYCQGCMKRHSHTLWVAPGDDSPSDIDELCESALLRELQVPCLACDGSISTVMAITLPSVDRRPDQTVRNGLITSRNTAITSTVTPSSAE